MRACSPASAAQDGRRLHARDARRRRSAGRRGDAVDRRGRSPVRRDRGAARRRQRRSARARPSSARCSRARPQPSRGILARARGRRAPPGRSRRARGRGDRQGRGARGRRRRAARTCSPATSASSPRPRSPTARPASRGSGSRCSGRSCRCSRRPPTMPASALASSRARRRSSSSSTAFASRSTRTATTSACTRAASTTSPPRVPEVVDAGRARCRRAGSILDGEAIALGAERPAAAVPGHDAAVRPPHGDALRARCRCRSRVRRAARRRPDAARASRRASGSRALVELAPALAVPRLVTGDADAAAAFYADAIAPRPRGRDGQGARRAVRRRQPRRGVAQDQEGPPARPRRARRRVGLAVAARAGCRTCTSARAIRPAASSCSARRSRA